MNYLRLAIFVVLALVTGRVFALYDPVPDPVLAGVQGEWRGSLTYRDYSKPDKPVTLPTIVFVALAAPDELVLHFVFGDGPRKKVFSYDRMKFDLTARLTLLLSPARLQLTKEEISSTGEITFRNRYEFARRGHPLAQCTPPRCASAPGANSAVASTASKR